MTQFLQDRVRIRLEQDTMRRERTIEIVRPARVNLQGILEQEVNFLPRLYGKSGTRRLDWTRRRHDATSPS